MFLSLFFFLALGASLAMWPEHFGVLSTPAARRRLKEIEGGATEEYFEERRTLQGLQPNPRYRFLWRIVGVAVAATTIILLVTEAQHRQDLNAARAEAHQAMAATRLAVHKAERGNGADRLEAQEKLAQSNAALERWERLVQK
jgi:hypothetical protein